MLTLRQRQALDYIQKYIAQNDGVSPSFTDIMAAVGMASKSGVYRLLEALEERGFIRRLPNRARAIELVDTPHFTLPLNAIPLSDLARECERRGYSVGRWELHREKLGEGYMETVHFRQLAPTARQA